MKQTIGMRIKDLRKGQQISQEELANEAEVTQQCLSRIENDKNEMTVSTALGIATALGVSLDYLVTGDDYDAD